MLIGPNTMATTLRIEIVISIILVAASEVHYNMFLIGLEVSEIRISRGL